MFEAIDGGEPGVNSFLSSVIDPRRFVAAAPIGSGTRGDGGVRSNLTSFKGAIVEMGADGSVEIGAAVDVVGVTTSGSNNGMGSSSVSYLQMLKNSCMGAF